jgi:hypothetical protein
VSCFIVINDHRKGLGICLDLFYGRGERTRTFDLTVPNRARYQLRHTPM